MTTHDFNDGNGPVPAHQHANGGGWVADTDQPDSSRRPDLTAVEQGREGTRANRDRVISADPRAVDIAGRARAGILSRKQH